MNARALLLALLVLVGESMLAGQSAWAVDTTPPLADPLLQQRYLALTHELRCMQCQNEAIADSPVSLAADLRRDVHDLVAAGKSDEEIRDYMVARYGDFILFRPRVNWRNAWLWGAPAVLMLLGAATAVRVLRQRQRLAAADTLPLEQDSTDLYS